MKPLRASGAACSLAIMIACSPVAFAQEDPITACQRAPDAETRIACLEEALRRQAGAPSDAPTATQPAPATPREPAQTATQERQSMAGRVGSALGSLNPFSGGEDRDSEDGRRQVSSQDAAAERFGASQVAARTATRATTEASAERMTARIANVSTVPFERLEVTLDNGQVWRQIAGDRQRLNERHVQGNSVDIWEARLGGYQMRLNEIARTIRVERIR